MKIYTGTGDSGKTSLFSGERLLKDDPRIEAYGAVDELSAIVGSLAAALPRSGRIDAVRTQLAQIQSDLFQVGAWLATMPDSPSADRLTPLTGAHSQRLESEIDAMQAELAPLKSFILAGGHASAGWAHLARTVCRRAERRAVTLSAAQAGESDRMTAVLVYLNRLSDYFFVLARFCNHLAGIKDVTWQG